MLNDISTNIRELTKNKIVVISSIIICITCLIIYNSFHKSLCKEEINKSENQLINKVIDKNHKDYYNYNGDGLQNLIDDKGNICNVIIITSPFTDKKYKEYLEATSRGVKFIGCFNSIYFPYIKQNIHDVLSNTHDITANKYKECWRYNYFNFCFGWFHSFRNPNTYIPLDIPKELVSISDFIRYKGFKYNKDVEKEYDFIYICVHKYNNNSNSNSNSNQNCEKEMEYKKEHCKLAKKCIDIMCNKYKMNGLLIGKFNYELPSTCHTLMETTDFIDYSKFIKQYEKCRFIFVPDLLEEYQSILTEALCFNLPCIVNKNILGGWKYVNEKTGMLFNDENDFENVLKQFQSKFNTFRPRDYFINNPGPEYEGKQIVQFIKDNIPNYKEEINLDLDKIDYLRPTI